MEDDAMDSVGVAAAVFPGPQWTAPKSLPRLTFLVVDDIEEMRVFFKKLLRYAGHDVFLAADAAEALQWARENDAHIGIIDREMPGTMWGVELSVELKRLHPTMDLALMTAWKDVLTASEAAMFETRFVKPLDAGEMLRAVRRLVRMRLLKEELRRGN